MNKYVEEYVGLDNVPCGKLFNSDELRRLQKAARDKDLSKVYEWGEQFEEQMRQEYERAYQKELGEAIENFLVAIAFTLHFNEKTKFGKIRLNDVMDDLMVTVNMFTNKEYNPEEYKKMLHDDGITMFD